MLISPEKYPGTNLSLDDQCKTISPDHVYYPRVNYIVYLVITDY